jgi:NAD-dependent SIR2 family protein deacetylase
MRPDVVLFGEAMPANFWTHIKQDFQACDLLLVFGTSLVVRWDNCGCYS